MKKLIAALLLVCVVTSLAGCRYVSEPTMEKLPYQEGSSDGYVAELSTDSTQLSSNSTENKFYCKEDCIGHILEPVSSSDQLPSCEEESNSFTIDMSFLGDCMLASYKGESKIDSFSMYAKEKDPSYFFEKVYSILESDDFTIANLENVLTDNDTLKEVKKDHNPAYWYKAPTSNTDILDAGSIEIVSMANNHFGDYGQQGRIDTMNALKEADIPFGTNDSTVYFEKQGFKIALICHGLWFEGQSRDIIARINEASKTTDYQIVYYHGGKERIHAPENWKVRESHKLVDAGADLVIGNHPHVLQPTEVYNGVNIVYSLGNFCFGGSSRPENRAIIYKIVLEIEDGVVKTENTEIIPCYVYTGTKNNWQPAPIVNEEEKQLVIDFMNGKEKQPY